MKIGIISDTHRDIGSIDKSIPYLKECDLISSSAKIEVTEDKLSRYVILNLRNASVRDQNVFNTAICELLSVIENPKYILIAKNTFGGYKYKLSFACPSIIGQKKEYINVLTKNLKKRIGKFVPIYTYKENGRKLILKCRKSSCVTLNERKINKKLRVSNYE